MSHANSNLQVSELDFNNIRESLKTYLQSQNQFVDYDFEGSNLGILLDILAYNTHYQTFFTNMVGNEMFLDSAQLRNSVVSRAKELGYRPTSAKGATATLNLTVTPSNSSVSVVTVSRNTEFTTTLNDETLTFVTPKTTTVRKNANNVFRTSVNITEGLPLTHKFTFGSNTEFTIPNDNVDTSSFRVRVQESASDTTKSTYTLANDVNELTGSSKVYFLEEDDDRQYKIYFGDNVLGKKPTSGNIVIVDYRITNGTLGNGANNFTLSGSIDGHSNVSFTVTSSATGGTNQESIESIKFNAPKHYEMQNRVVTKKDYERTILHQNPDLQAVNVWGGEDNDPPQYGKVFISVKPTLGTVISNARKESIADDLKKLNVLSIDPEFVDAEFLYLKIDSTVNYDPDLTNDSSNDIKTAVISKIINFGTTNLGQFGNKFRYSKLIKSIDSVDNAILSNLTEVQMERRIEPTPNVAKKYTIKFNNPFSNQDPNHVVHSGHIPTVFSENSFTYNGFTAFLQDDGSGNIFIYRLRGSDKVKLVNNAGTVNYETGTVVLNSFNPSAISNSGVLNIIAKPKQNNITPLRDQIILIEESDITVTMQSENS